MRKDIRGAIVAIVVMTIVLGIVYPLAMTGVGQVAFPNAADGSTVKVDGRVVGSKLIGQDFSTGPSATLLPEPPVGHGVRAERDVLQQPRAQPGDAGRPAAALRARLPRPRAPVRPTA